MSGITITFVANSRAALTFKWPLNSSVFGQGIDSAAFGTALFGRPVAYLSPASLDDSAAGSPTIHQALNLDGLAATQWGMAAVVEQSPIHAAEGFNTLEFGVQVRARDPANDAAFHFTAPIWPSLTFRWPTSDTSVYLFPSSIPAESPPAPTVSGMGLSVLATGWSALGIGPPVVQGTAWFINLSTHGIAYPTVSAQDKPTVDFALRTLRPTGLDATQWGTAFMGGGVRQIDQAGRGTSGPLVGTAFVAYAVRELQPLWFAPWAVPSPLVGFHREVLPSGAESAAFGQAEVLDNSQRAYPPSDNPQTEWGANRVSHYQQAVTPPGLPARNEYGRPTVFPWHQYLFPFTDHPSIWGPYYPDFTLVELRDKTLGTAGWRDSRHGWETVVSLAGLPYFPEGWDSATFGKHLAADRIRTVPAEPWDSQDFGRWLVVYNAARVLAPVGPDVAAFGVASIESNRRWCSIVHGAADGAVGVPMVADRIRVLFPYRIDPPYMPFPYVHHQQEFVAPAGILPKEVGAHALYEFRILITPRWTLRDGYGEPRVRNVTPELPPLGYDQSEWGNTRIRLQWRRLEAQGHDSASPGPPAVEFRTRRVWPFPMQTFALVNSPNTRVRKALPDPPAPQMIRLDAIEGVNIGDGIGPPNWPLSPPRVTSNVLEHKQQSPFTGYGAPEVWANSIHPLGIVLFENNKYGIPSLNGTQWVQPEGAPPVFLDDRDPTNRVDPITIWACTEYPGPPELRKGHIIDYYVHGGDGGPSWGQIKVTRHPAPCQPQGIQGDWRGYGEPEVSHWRRWLYPEGIKSFHYGVPVLPTGTDFKAEGADSAVFGDTVVTHYLDPLLPRRVYPVGAWGWVSDKTWVSNWVRLVYPGGVASPGMGRPEYVGPPIPVVGEGWDSAILGDAWPSCKIRALMVEGFEATEMLGYSLGAMRDRLRLRQRFMLPVSSWDSLGIGPPAATPRVREVLAAGHDHAALPALALRWQNRVNGAGWDALTFGDIDRWEAGKLKPHGDDLLRCGEPKLPRGARPATWDGACGAPAVAHLLRPGGEDTMDVPIPVLVASICGRRAMAARGTDFLQFGTEHLL